MRIVLAVATGVIGLTLALPATAGPVRKQKYVKKHTYWSTQRATRQRPHTNSDYQYQSFEPADHPVGSLGWWRAMDRQHRGGFRSG